LEQLNIVGKRSGEGFVSHKSTMVNVLSRGLAPRLLLLDFTIGRKGLLNCIRSLAGSNVVKVVPSANGGDSEEHTTDKRLKVVCGNFTTHLDDMAWVDEKMAHTYAEVRISPANTVTPNIGSTELGEAISQILPFTATDDARPVLQCVKFEAGDGKLKLIAADGFVLGMVTLDFDGGEGTVLAHRDDLKDMASALRKAKRVRLTFDKAGSDDGDMMALYIDTESARYKFPSVIGQFPDYDRVMPPGFATTIQMDAVEVLKAVNTLKTTADNPKDYAVDLTIGDGALTLATPDRDGSITVNADVGDAEAHIRLDGKYLVSAMKAMGGMTDFSLNKAYEPCQFSADGFMLLIMPMVSNRAREEQRSDSEAQRAEAGEQEQAEAEPASEAETGSAVEAETQQGAEGGTEAETEESTEPAEPEAKPKRSRSRKKEPVAVA